MTAPGFTACESYNITATLVCYIITHTPLTRPLCEFLPDHCPDGGGLPVRALEVLTTIKPLGFIAAAITDGVSEPGVLLPTGGVAHDFSLRPSDMRSINEADLVVWVGPELEGFMAKPLARHPHVLTLTQVPGMPLYNYATQGNDDHHHDDKDHDHAAHDHGSHDEGP